MSVSSRAKACITERHTWNRSYVRARTWSWWAAVTPPAKQPFFWRKLRDGCTLVRSGGLSDTMSRYLIHRISEHPGIELHVRTEIVGMYGDGQLERIEWKNNSSGETSMRDIRHVFMMAGASPRTEWLQGCLVLDEKGFVVTGTDLATVGGQQRATSWPLARPPQLLETSLPGVFAVGDVRSGSVKRVASAVGEGAIVVHLVHRTLAEL